MSTFTATKVKLFADLYEDGITIDADVITRANNEDGDAMWRIGLEYKNEKQQYDKALAWYRLAALKNNPSAQNSIGYLYHNGKGVPQDYLLAMDWWIKAVVQNNKAACGNIGVLFEYGFGVPVNKYKALEWYYRNGEKQDTVNILAHYGQIYSSC